MKELIKRGKKKLDFIEIDFDNDFGIKLKTFLSKTRNGNKPQLKNLFRTEPDSSQRIFTAIDKNSNWQGLITLTKNSVCKYHCELLRLDLIFPHDLKHHKQQKYFYSSSFIFLNKSLAILK